MGRHYHLLHTLLLRQWRQEVSFFGYLCFAWLVAVGYNIAAWFMHTLDKEDVPTIKRVDHDAEYERLMKLVNQTEEVKGVCESEFDREFYRRKMQNAADVSRLGYEQQSFLARFGITQ